LRKPIGRPQNQIGIFLPTQIVDAKGGKMRERLGIGVKKQKWLPVSKELSRLLDR
jgi:hypothetical protein